MAQLKEQPRTVRRYHPNSKLIVGRMSILVSLISSVVIFYMLSLALIVYIDRRRQDQKKNPNSGN
jgi:hypothetical protein